MKAASFIWVRRCSSKSKTGQAFTIVEMLAVILIIMILLALVAGVARHMGYQTALTQTQTDLQRIITALEAYKNDNFYYPKNTVTFTALSTKDDYKAAAEQNSKLLYRALYTDQVNPPGAAIGPKQRRPTVYLTNIREDAIKNGDHLVDAWQRPYNYDAASDANVRKNPASYFDLWSSGRDGETDRGQTSVSKDDIWR